MAEIIGKDPANLQEIKFILQEYVENQDINYSAIVGFRTTGFGKLTDDPSIDPDHSQYVYFLEQGNNYRLRLQDGLSAVNAILDHQLDFGAADIKDAGDTRDEIECELKYIETALQSCRLSFDTTRRLLVDRTSINDRSAELAMTYGIKSNSVSPRLKICPYTESSVAEIKSGRAAEPREFLTLGWARGSVQLAAAEGDKPAALLESRNFCKDRLKASQRRFGEMLGDTTAGSKVAALPVKGGKPQVPGPICVTGCEFERNNELIAKIAALKTTPFEISFWLDSLSSGFGSANAPGLYINLQHADKVRQVRFYNDKEDAAFAVRYNPGKLQFTVFVELKALNTDKAPVRLEVETVNGNTYVAYIPKIQLL